MSDAHQEQVRRWNGSAWSRLLPRRWADTAATGDPPPPELPLPIADAMSRVRSIIDALPRWRVESIDEANRTLHATRRTRMLGFVDDVTLRLESLDGGRTRVHAHSESRVGLSDLGENRRGLIELFAALMRKTP